MIARRLHEDRDRAGHDDAVKDRFMAVAVDDDHVTGGDGVMPDHLVRGRGAVGHEKAVIGVEDARGGIKRAVSGGELSRSREESD